MPKTMKGVRSNDKWASTKVQDTSAFVASLESTKVDFTGEMKQFYITSYRNYLIKQQYELSTVNKKVNSIHSFNRYLVDNDCTKDNEGIWRGS